MFRIDLEKSKKSKCNAHVANQFRMTDVSLKTNGQANSWPLECKLIDLDKNIFPESCSGFPVSGRFYGNKAS